MSNGQVLFAGLTIILLVAYVVTTVITAFKMRPKKQFVMPKVENYPLPASIYEKAGNKILTVSSNGIPFPVKREPKTAIKKKVSKKKTKSKRKKK